MAGPHWFYILREVLFAAYLVLLSLQDLKSRSFAPWTIISGGGAGAVLCISEGIAFGTSAGELLSAHLPGILIGLVLLLAGRLTKGAIGSGDGLCFISFIFWKTGGALAVLLFGGLCLCALFGAGWMIIKKKEKTASLPFMPFVLAAELVLALTDAFQGA